MDRITLWNGEEVPRIGMGCWAIGGALYAGSTPLSYGAVDDAASHAGIAAALDLGVRVFDTSPNYGAGHSEIVLGEALERHPEAMILTKVGHSGDLATRQANPPDASPAAVRASVEASRKRLRRDRLDLVQLHLGDLPMEEARAVFDTCDALVAEGKVAAYGWSTDLLDRIEAVADRSGFVAVQFDFNLFQPRPDMLEATARHRLVALNRLPLAMGLLSGKYGAGSNTGADDVRASGMEWLRFFKDGAPVPDFTERLERVRRLLTVEGRSVAQGALGWILARAPNTLPLPGFKSEAQVRDNIGAIEKGPLPAEIMAEIDIALGYAQEDA